MQALGDKDLFGNVVMPPDRCILSGRFIVPPFSILNAREGDWQERKRRWLSLGIKSETGRGAVGDKEQWEKAIPGGGTGANSAYKFKTDTGYETGEEAQHIGTGTSIFDPVLCEVIYRWFCPVGGKILDPFAGGSVRGVVASLLGHKYIGVDLRREQVEANEAQAKSICVDEMLMPAWICGDSMNIDSLAFGHYDFIFSCPPYGDLEKYSDDPRDLSNISAGAFDSKYHLIVQLACSMLKEDSFACFVVGDYRDDSGFYRDFVSKTIKSFSDAGLKLYNHAILITAVGSLPIRITKQFNAGRKLGQSHQNVLVFCKGCPRKATLKLGKIYDNPSEQKQTNPEEMACLPETVPGEA